MAQTRVAQVVRVYVRVASLVLLFLGVTALLYFFLPPAAPIEPSSGVGAGNRANVAIFPNHPRRDPSTSSSSSSATSPSSPIPSSGGGTSSAQPQAAAAGAANESCSLDQVLQPPIASPAASRTPVPTRGPPRVERYQASIVVPLLSFNPNITANVARLLAFINTTYLPHLVQDPARSSSSPSSAAAGHVLRPRQSAAAGQRASAARTEGNLQEETVMPVEVLLVVDPARLPILNEETARQLFSSSSSATAPSSQPRALPSLQPQQQWEVYALKKLLSEFQYELRLRDLTYLRLLALPSTTSTSGSCYTSGGEAFGAACNLGAARARGQWLIFLSAETSFEEGWFEEQMQAIEALHSTPIRSRTSDHATAKDGHGKIGLIGCKILTSDEKVHSAGLDVALSRREVKKENALASPSAIRRASSPVASTPGVSQAPSGGRKRGRALNLLDPKILSDWQAEQAKHNARELRSMMESEALAQREASLDGSEEDPTDIIAFPYRRLEGVARTDERLDEEADIIAPSSQCFIVAKSVLHEASGFKLAGTALDSASPSDEVFILRTPFLQVLDLSLRLRKDSGRKSVYLPTSKAVIRHKPEGSWNLEEDTTREDHGICSSTIFPAQPSPSPSSTAFNTWNAYTLIQTQASATNSMPLFPQPLSVPELEFARQWRSEMMRPIVARRQVDVDLTWDFYGGCTGWGLEAVRFVTSLEPRLHKVAVVADEKSFCKGLPRHLVQSLRRLRSLLDIAPTPGANPNPTADDRVRVWVSHKPPVSYPTFPYKGSVVVSQKQDYVIGRSMTEADSIPKDWAEHAKRVDEIWLPSSFLVDAFVSGGVPKNKLLVLPIPIDTRFFSPHPFISSSDSTGPALRPLPLPNKGDFNFLSVFKWEQRKGWDILLEAYVKEFKPEDNTTLYLQTYLPNSGLGRDKEAVDWKVKQFLASLFQVSDASSHRLPRIEILSEELPEQSMPRLYAAVDAFVLPTRGEGFGMPVMEAMSMALPVIATNWSGPVDFINEHNAYPLRVEGLVPAVDTTSWTTFAGKWAKPSVEHLRQLMRHVYTNREEAKRKGQRARQDIVADYREAVVADRVVQELKRIDGIVRERRNTRGQSSSFSSPSAPSASP